MIAVFLIALAAFSDENSDLNFIPTFQNKESVTQSAPSSISGRSYVEEAFTGWWNRSGLLVPVPVNGPNWQSRTSLDTNLTWQSRDNLSLHFNNRLNVFFEDDVNWPNRGASRNDLKELFVSYEASDRTYLEVGRINLRHGVALGFNPTDFFKSRSLVSQVSIDPSSIRENRLGTVAIQAQKIWDKGTFTIGISPQIQPTSQITTAKSDLLDLHLGQTNSVSRIYASGTIAWDALSPEFLVMNDDIGTHLGLNLSHVIGQSVVAYLEWSGVTAGTLSSRATQFGQSTGTLPAGFPIFPQTSTQSFFQNDVALGASWTSPSKFTLNLEYHFHQSGFTSQDFTNWLTGGNWYVRQFASDQREPLMQGEVFLRMDYPDAIATNWNLGALAFVNPFDGSTLAQISTQYLATKSWSFGAYLSGTLGGLSTENGSLPFGSSLTAQIVRYL